MAQQPRLERQLKSPSSKTLNEERAPFSRSQKGRKGTFPPTSCSATPAAPALWGHALWPDVGVPAGAAGQVTMRALCEPGSVCAGPQRCRGSRSRCAATTAGTRAVPASQRRLSPIPALPLGPARSEGKLFFQQHCPARTRFPGDCPAAGRIPTDFLCRRLSSWLGPHLPRGCRQRGTASPGNDGVSSHPPRSGHRVVPEGQGTGSGHQEDGARNVWSPGHWLQTIFWV